jgi:hypothetical protein
MEMRRIILPAAQLSNYQEGSIRWSIFQVVFIEII